MSKKIKYFSTIIICFMLISTSIADPNLPYKEDELIVRFAPKTNGIQKIADECNQVLAVFNAGEVKDSVKLVPGLSLVKLPANLTVPDALSKLKGKGEILYAEPNYKIKAASTIPNDTYFNNLWGMTKISAPQAWDIRTGSNIVVAVIDSGVDYTHLDLAANMWVNPGEIPGNGIDDDHNGYVDDIYGYDFCTWYGHVRDSDPMDDWGHGTHCAGIIGAVGNNNRGVTGVCWNVKIMALKFFDSSGNGWSYDAIACINYAVQMGAKVLNNSWGGYKWDYPSYPADVQALKDAVEAAGAAGVLVVAAAQNQGNDIDATPVYPASYDCDNIISVMATDEYDNRAEWNNWENSSNYGSISVDLAAPGASPYNSGILSCWLGGGYDYSNGTSMAAPHVAGAAALIWALNPSMHCLNVKDFILNSVDTIPALENDPYLGRLCVTGGRLNLRKAVRNAATLSSNDDVSDGSGALPGSYVTYTVKYANPITNASDPDYGNLYNVVLVDYLPAEIYLDDVVASDGGTYDFFTGTVTWNNIGTLTPGQMGSVTVRIRVNEFAEPAGTITNHCEMTSNTTFNTAQAATPIGNWNPGVIYVNKNAIGSNTGMSWEDAYTDLQDALERAGRGCGSEIWVAAGVYKPTTNPSITDATFNLRNNVAIYGGFAGSETSRSLRNTIANETILDGDINDNGYQSYEDISYLVTALDVNQTAVIDGFTIRKAYWGGIKTERSSPTIRNNKITGNYYRGIDCRDNSSPTITDCRIQNSQRSSYASLNFENSSATVSNCTIEDNAGDGISCWSSGLTLNNTIIQKNNYGINYQGGSGLTVTGSRICRNRSYGIYIYTCNSQSQIKNNWIHDNSNDGIYVGNAVANQVTIRNNTVADNTRYGINSYFGDTYAKINNCIIWGNTLGQLYKTIGGFSTFTKYSCIQNWTGGGTGNINTNPSFFNHISDPNDYHIGPGSPCIDTGDPAGNYPGETDIDGENRVIDGDANGTVIVDMGADEYYWSRADFNHSKVVDFNDYTIFAKAWLTIAGNSNYNEACDLKDDNTINYSDLGLFGDDWLWRFTEVRVEEGLGGQGVGEGLLQEQSLAQPMVAQPEQAEVVLPVDVEGLLNWLDEIWNTGDLQGIMTESEYLEFRESIKTSGEQDF